MVRRHGWQLPAHTFQVVAITVFFLLAVAFFIFLAPFLWLRGLESAAFAIYSPLFFAVLLLYVRCSAINPADPGVFGNQPLSKHDENSSFSQLSGAMSSPLSALQSEKDYSHKSSLAEQGRVGWDKPPSLCSVAGLCALSCGWLVSDDNCINEARFEQPVPEEDILFCTLCNAEVRKYSKHCRSCDKCVDGFDHHCREIVFLSLICGEAILEEVSMESVLHEALWLNNCVGRKNYSTFVALMATSLSLLVVEWGIGAAVFIRCFVDRRGTENQIVDKLGNGFSTAPFAAVVLLCTIVAFLASIPLGELFFFHLILMRKGITTYEYVVAMRAQNDAPALGEEEESVLSSPGGSTTTGISGASSLGLKHRGNGGWCTPPRIFIEHQVCHDLGSHKRHSKKTVIETIMEEPIVEEERIEEPPIVEEINGKEVTTTNMNEGNNTEEPNTETPSFWEEFAPQLAPSKGPSSVDPETAGRLKKRPPANVRISAWRLAKLDAQEASQAAQKARENSSVLQKVGQRDLINVPETDNSSSSNISSRSGLSMEYALKRAMQKGPDKLLTPRGLPSLNSDLSRTSTAKMPVPSVLPLEAAEGDSEALSSIDSHSVTSTIPDSMSMSPLPAERRYRVSERPYSITALGMHGALGEPLPSNSTAAVPSTGGRSSWPAYQGSSISNTPTVGRTYVPSWDVSPGVPDSLVSSTRGRNTFLRDLRRNPVFWSRPGLGRFGGDTSDVGRTPSRIVFGGSGISTSTYASQVLRHGSSIRNPVAHSDASDGDIASESGHESVSTSMSPSTSGLRTSPALPRQLKSSGDFSIFNGAPILPVGDGKMNRKESSQPPPRKPPLNPKTEVQRPLGVIVPRSQSPRSS